VAEILCAGVTHHPGFAYPDEHMADILRRALNSERVPSAMKDPQSWPEDMRRQFGLNGERHELSRRAP